MTKYASVYDISFPDSIFWIVSHDIFAWSQFSNCNLVHLLLVIWYCAILGHAMSFLSIKRSSPGARTYISKLLLSVLLNCDQTFPLMGPCTIECPKTGACGDIP